MEAATLKRGAVKITFDSARKVKLVKNKFCSITLLKGLWRREG